jgi:taurine--2-oxoglutarate transaminase
LKYPVGYLKKVREICDKHGILFIADEVMSGFGRTGKWFGVDNHGCTRHDRNSKRNYFGYLPLGALIVSDKIAERYDDNVLWLGLTYSAHPVSLSSKFRSIENL